MADVSPGISLAPFIAGCLLLFTAALHSWLGERLILGPLLAQPLPKLRLGPAAMARILRFAWHITSLAWLGAAAGAMLYAFDGTLGAQAYLLLFAATAFVSGLLVYVISRGAHLAWPLFFGITLLLAATALPGLAAAARLPAAALAAALLLGAGLLHLYWAAGGTYLRDGAIPRKADGEPALRPRPGLTGCIGLLLCGVALIYWLAATTDAIWARWLCLACGAVFALRLLGDGRYVGISKRQRGSVFAARDDAFYNPVMFVLAAVAALLAS